MKTTFGRKALAGSTAALAAFALLGLGVAPASALESNHVYLNFAAGDTLGNAASSFEGGESAVGATTHLSNNSLKITKKASGQPWSGVNLLLPSAGSTARLASAASHTVTLDWWNPDSVAGPVMLKMETAAQPSWAGGPWVAKTLEAAPGLNHLTFDMSTGTGWNDAIEYDVMAVFGNWGADDAAYTGAAAFTPNVDQVYEVDNISVNGATSADALAADVTPRAATSTLLTFEAADTLGALAAGDSSADKAQGGFEGLSTSIADAPAGGNGGKALKMIKNAGAQTYAGVNLVKFAADTRVTDATHKVITMNYYSAKANSTVRLEVRPYPAALGMNVTATKVGWQTLTFDFTNVAGWTGSEEFVGLTLFPDFDVAGANTTYYVDNVAFNGATTPAIPAPVVKPTVRVAATVSGTAKVGKTLTAGKGSYNGSAATYTYKWYRCTVLGKTATTAAPAAAAKCSVISGATTSSHKVVTADVGKYLRVLVTARNASGSALSLSKSTAAKATK